MTELRNDRELRALAAALRMTHERAEALTHEMLPPESAEKVRRIFDEQRSLLVELSRRLETLDQRVEHVNDTVADRLNNVLMSVQTVSDLLRRSPTLTQADEICQRLQTTVETGRDAMKKIKAGLRTLR